MSKHGVVPRIGLLATCALFALFCCRPAAVLGYTEDHPKVKEMIGKAVRYLSTHRDMQLESRLGGRCLVALALKKANQPLNHPLIVNALERCKNDLAQFSTREQEKDVYNIGLALIFLCEMVNMDDSQSRENMAPLIRGYADELVRRQRSDGSWAYPSAEDGDTSVTQYAVLALWSMKVRGFKVDPSALDRVLGWLIRTQDVSGAWAYRGKDPGGYARLDQRTAKSVSFYNRVSSSMVVAGLGSVLMAADGLGVSERAKRKAEAMEGIPDSFELVEKRAEEGGEFKPTVSEGALRACILDGISYYKRNCPVETDFWQYYYLYGMERYESFLEQEVDEKERVAEPAWYNAGVDFLYSRQEKDGNWNGQIDNNVIHTAFSILFLIRGTKKSIQEALGGGTLIGGRELPKDVSALQTDGEGKVIVPEVEASLNAVLDMIDSQESLALDKVAPVALSVEPTAREQEMAKFKELIAGENFAARRFAVRTLARARDLDTVPVLIYALSDPDRPVAVEALEGLRFLSRKMTAGELPESPEAATPEEFATKWAQSVRPLQDQWKKWYLSIRPDADLAFLDEAQ